MIKYFCVSDIHSFYEPLMKALTEKGFEMNNKCHKLLLLGDAFDRGDDTIKVFEFLKTLADENRLIYVMGNHEELFFDCLKEIDHGKTPSSHHFHNKTVKTICMLCGQNEWVVYAPHAPDIKQMIKEKTKPVADFIKQNAVNYFQLGNKVFVHSWIPCQVKGNDYTWNPVYEKPFDWWDKKEEELNEEERNLFDAEWSAARWGNPYLMWKNKLYPKDICIVFGHFHTSYGHSRIDMKCKEWPQQNKVDWQSAFKPWIKENAIGIDACCAYSGFINCLVFDENGELIKEDAE